MEEGRRGGGARWEGNVLGSGNRATYETGEKGYCSGWGNGADHVAGDFSVGSGETVGGGSLSEYVV